MHVMALGDKPNSDRMVVLKPDTPINELGARYYKLRKILDENSRWASFLEMLPYAECSEIELKARAAERIPNSSPADIILWWLATKCVTVQMIKEWLKDMQLERALVVLEDDVPLRIVEQPTSHAVLHEGDELTLVFEAKSVPEPEYQWFKHDDNEDCIELEGQNRSTLRILSAELKDAGVYVCRAHTNYMSGNRDHAFSDFSVVEVVPSGFRTLPSNPQPCYDPQHQMNNRVLGNNVGLAEEVDQNWMICGRVSETFTTVKATEPAKNDIRDLKIIKHPVSPGIVNQGSTVVLECKAQSSLPVHYQWYCNGMKILGETSQELKLGNLFIDSYTGEYYHCEVYTEVERLYSRSTSVQLSGFDDSIQYFAADKVALLMANTNYEELADLFTPQNDVATLSAKLKSIGFKVIALMNLNLIAMKKAVYVFCESLRKGAYGLVYYAGHGFELFGQSYFQPVNASGDYCVPHECLCAEEVLQNMQEKELALSVLLIDMCRKLPPEFREGKGIQPGKIYEPVMKRNIVYGYATSFLRSAYESKKSANGYFMKHLKDHITKNQCILDVLQRVKCDVENDPAVRQLQYPWIGSSLTAKRKLTDPIIDETSAVVTNDVSWEELQSSPFQDIKVRFPHLRMALILEFHPHMKEFCNAADLYIYVNPEDEETCANICQFDFSFRFNLEDIPHNVREDKGSNDDTRICCCVIEIFDLQKIECDLTGILQVTHRQTGQAIAKIETLPFVQPPISRFKYREEFWQKLRETLSENCCWRLPMNIVPSNTYHVQNHHCVQSEDEDLITFSEEKIFTNEN